MDVQAFSLLFFEWDEFIPGLGVLWRQITSLLAMTQGRKIEPALSPDDSVRIYKSPSPRMRL